MTFYRLGPVIAFHFEVFKHTKGHTITCHEATEEGSRYNSTLSLTSALDRVGGQRHDPAALTKPKSYGTHYRGGWVGLTAGLDGRSKNSLVSTGVYIG